MLEVLACPVPMSVQDLGRYGYRHFGVPVSGALDPFSLRLVNALVRNAKDAAALEMRLTGPRLQAHEPVRVALARASGVIERVTGEQHALPSWQSATLAAGDQLRIGAVQGGAGYLAVAGGIDVPLVLGSRSTYARAGLGVTVREGTWLPVGSTRLNSPELVAPLLPEFDSDAPVRCIPGPQREAFTAEALDVFLSSEYVVTPAADRMGLRLAGPILSHVGGADIVSDAVTPGAIQVPGDGQPIVLLADGQTVGGYAKIATVIVADLPRLGRLLPGAKLRFAFVDSVQALVALKRSEEDLARLIAGLRPLASGLDLEALYQGNLVDGVVRAE